MAVTQAVPVQVAMVVSVTWPIQAIAVAEARLCRPFTIMVVMVAVAVIEVAGIAVAIAVVMAAEQSKEWLCRSLDARLTPDHVRDGKFRKSLNIWTGSEIAIRKSNNGTRIEA